MGAGILEHRDPLSWTGALDPIGVGRGNIIPVELPGRPPITVIVKTLKRGGIVGLVNREIHFSEDRLIGAIRLSNHLSRRKVPASEVLFGRSEKMAGPFFRLCLATREIEKAVSLLDFLADATHSAQRKTDVARSAGKSIRSLHDAGVFHADLNMHNLLVAPAAEGGDGLGVSVIDLDGSRIEPTLGRGARAANLARLLRHAVKNSLHCSVDLPALGRALLEGYCGDGDRMTIESRVVSILKRTLPLHRISWRMQGIDPPSVSFER